MALTTLPSLKCFLGIRSNTEDARLAAMIDAADAAIKEYLGRDIEQATYTEFYSGDGMPLLILRQRPVISITSIHVDSGAYYGQASGAFSSSTILVAGTEYALVFDTTIGAVSVSRRGIVERINSVWPLAISSGAFYPAWSDQQRTGGLSHEPPLPRAGNIKVVYVAGYTVATKPKDLELAENLYVSHLRRTAKFGGGSPQSESLGQYSYSLFGPSSGNGSGAEMASIRQILSRYREVAV